MIAGVTASTIARATARTITGSKAWTIAGATARTGTWNWAWHRAWNGAWCEAWTVSINTTRSSNCLFIIIKSVSTCKIERYSNGETYIFGLKACIVVVTKVTYSSHTHKTHTAVQEVQGRFQSNYCYLWRHRNTQSKQVSGYTPHITSINIPIIFQTIQSLT